MTHFQSSYEELTRREQAEIAQYDQVLEAPSRLKSEITRRARVKTQGQIAFIESMGLPAIFCGIAIGFVHIGFSVLVGVLYLYLWNGAHETQRHTIEADLRNAAGEMQRLEQKASLAERQIARIKHRYQQFKTDHCDRINGYPPDWKERRKKVLRRDNNQCTQCGWSPLSAKRRTRQLHVHHITAISDGGTNELTNLVTLCHICHRGVDKKHAYVRKL